MNKDKDHMDTALEPMVTVVIKRVVVRDKTKGFVDEYFAAQYHGHPFKGFVGVGRTRGEAVSNLERKHARNADNVMSSGERMARHILIEVDMSSAAASDCQL